MPKPLTVPEASLALACAVLALAAAFGAPLAQPAAYHQLADQRELLGLPFAMDVLSNLPFLLAGLAGLWLLRGRPGLLAGRPERKLATLFFAGLACTAAGSAFYHWQPDDAGLVVDRLAMVLPFAGLLGLAAAGISSRAGIAVSAGVLLAGPVAVGLWAASGNLLPWAMLQAGGMVLVACLACAGTRPGALAVRWWPVLLAYALAKLLELGDQAVFEATAGWVSGHSLKHVVAALAAWPVLAALWALPESGQNAAGSQTSTATTGRLARNA
ncbi:MAG TPA: hypothetical protein VLJ58_11240 [Ramlibacter sp.]|nr:hypothetical protein [Ramlibacter sp.]